MSGIDSLAFLTPGLGYIKDLVKTMVAEVTTAADQFLRSTTIKKMITAATIKQHQATVERKVNTRKTLVSRRSTADRG
jgi:hypothetical protein